MLSKITMAAIAALVLTTASASAQGEVGGSQFTVARTFHRDPGYDGRGCTNYLQYLYDANDCR
jgi:hypothetical protein